MPFKLALYLYILYMQEFTLPIKFTAEYDFRVFIWINPMFFTNSFDLLILLIYQIKFPVDQNLKKKIVTDFNTIYFFNLLHLDACD